MYTYNIQILSSWSIKLLQINELIIGLERESSAAKLSYFRVKRFQQNIRDIIWQRRMTKIYKDIVFFSRFTVLSQNRLTDITQPYQRHTMIFLKKDWRLLLLNSLIIVFFLSWMMIRVFIFVNNWKVIGCIVGRDKTKRNFYRSGLWRLPKITVNWCFRYQHADSYQNYI